MKSEFEIELLDVSPGDTVAPLCIRAGGEVFTRLFRFDSAEYDDYVEADPRKLAFWLVDNYWRLRWECPPTSGLRTTEWRLRHELTAIGEYAWPRLTIWGDGPEVWLQSVPDLPGIPGPVKFLDECSVAIRGASFETGVRTFLSNVIDSFSSSATDTEALRALNFAWQKELAESSIATWRKREAQCGFDVDEAPEELMYRLEVLAQDFGDESIGEATQAVPGSKGADVLQDCLNEARDAGLSCNFADVVSHFIPHHVAAKFELAWPEAESIAEEMRGNYGLGNGPLPSKQLFAILGLTSRAFDTL
ncbi:hypothetical protein, partial [Ramlibacter sp.]|uniref:hypothetical protein n=1 Tax=Ramlibacter sp. TaxID=1917967 RepID=UPI003D0D6772